jgi:hypothetical protein
MTFLHSLLSLPREGLIIAATVVAGLLVVCLSALFSFSRRRFITIKRSEETDLIAFHIRRIADAVEKLAAAPEAQPPADATKGRQVGMSISSR